MSLSQKHSNLTLVPWFNRNEWDYVYENAYSDHKEQQVKALDLLKVWKLRTPVLPAGVEGTLVILEAILTNDSLLTVEQLCHLYAIGIMRFLNLSAANSEKQGDFARTSMKNELPKWLIILRHDIAHGHQIPSLSSLRMGLEYGLQWLKEKYWEPQCNILRDYVAIEECATEDLAVFLSVYVQVKMESFKNKGISEKAVQNIILRSIIQMSDYGPVGVEILEEMIKQSLPLGQNKSGIGDCLKNVLVTDNALLFGKPESAKIDVEFKKLWSELLNILQEKKLLFVLIGKLYDITIDIEVSHTLKSVAALWIYEILLSLFALKYSKDNENVSISNYIELYSYDTYVQEALRFQEQVLKSFNSYSLYFIEMLLKYNENSDSFIVDTLSLIKHDNSDIKNVTDKIFTLDDLNLEETFEDTLGSIGNSPNINVSRCVRKIVGQQKWTKIEDTSIFANCPFGVLPHQIDLKHPFILM
ncbi:uncharacterized protein LOC132705978 [Cylas formicarius]|uniref:uncharacterized protein LOC132705978 n=1 Tax=Cylas formicarius TaxID=197179 RepID=UPI00295891AA|nr:uncharacterized protein LOC132705978 [Cylas formicarius]